MISQGMVPEFLDHATGGVNVQDPRPGAEWDHWIPKREYDEMFRRYMNAVPGSDKARYYLWWLARWPTC